MKKVLTIAGADSSGGAGIQADIKTMTAHGVYAMSVITALTAQNTTGVYGIFDVSPDFVANQFDCVFTDIFPDAVKIGMVHNSSIIEVIADKLKQYNAKNIVVDPVMVSTSKSRLIDEKATEGLIKKLFPLSNLITPNIVEAEVLSGIEINNKISSEKAAVKLYEFLKGSVLIKGGHFTDNADDLLYDGKTMHWISGERINNTNTHGTGCTLSSAIACNLACGMTMLQSVENAKNYVAGALRANLDLGKGNGPLNHCYELKRVGE